MNPKPKYKKDDHVLFRYHRLEIMSGVIKVVQTAFAEAWAYIILPDTRYQFDSTVYMYESDIIGILDQSLTQKYIVDLL